MLTVPHQRRWLLLVKLRALSERLRGSLFFIPCLYVIGAILLAELLLSVDRGAGSVNEPGFLRSTVASGRAILSTIAGAIVTVTGLVFSLVVVALQLASTQFSPRVLRTLFRSRFQQSTIGFMVGTFTYCLVVLRVIRTPFGSGNSESIVPSIAITGGVVLGIGSILAIVAYVDYTARSMQVVELVRRITEEALVSIRRLPCSGQPDGAAESSDESQHTLGVAATSRPEDVHALVVRAAGHGWVQQANAEALLAALPPGATLQLEINVGEYVFQSRPLARVWPAPPETDRIERAVRAAVQLGRERTLQQDLAFGLRQLVDIALQALSPSINAPTTAYQCIVHLGELLYDILLRDLPPACLVTQDERRLLRPHEFSYADYVDRAFDQIRLAGVNQPPIAIILLETLGMLAGELDAAGFACRGAPLKREARLVLAGGLAAAPLPEDAQRIRATARASGFEIEN